LPLLILYKEVFTVENNALELRNITKRFGKVLANNKVNLTLKKGEILSILGENGSGKTTLMNMVSGIYYPDEGEILINGEPVVIHGPLDAFNHRIGMIHQHFKLVDAFTATENVLLGLSKDDFKELKQTAQEKLEDKKGKIGDKEYLTEDEKEKLKAYKRYARRSGFNKKGADERIKNLANKYGFNIEPGKYVYDMSVSEKQTLEIVKVLYRGVDVLILDEPTAVLTPQEIKKLFLVLRNMRDAGKSIIIITHKLNEVMEISDRVAILRKGEHIATVKTSETDEKKLTELMVGEKVELNIERSKPVNPVDRLFVKNLNVTGMYGEKILKDINLTIRSGEILGIAGIAGSGQKELLEAIGGLHSYDGEVIFHNPKENLPVTFFHKDLKLIKKLALENKFHYEPTFKKQLEEENKFGTLRQMKKKIVELTNNARKCRDQDDLVKAKEYIEELHEYQKHLDFAKAYKGRILDNNEFVSLKGLSNKKIKLLVNEGKILFNADEIVDLKNKNPQQIRELGIRLSFVPEDRLGMGLVANMSLTDNTMLRSYHHGHAFFLDRQRPKKLTEKIIYDLHVSTPNTDIAVSKLSGGNVQKILVGREIALAPKVLMTAYPVRGLDINSSYTIYKLLEEQKKKGIAVIYVGEDLDVLLALSDRIAVMCNGTISKILDPKKVTKEEIGLYMVKEGGK